ncbi:hypothetical protein AHAS_Ahas03G0209400 [Arachis hypogaea]
MKKNLVDELGFGAMRRISGLNLTHQMLKELTNLFYLYNSSLDTWYRKIKITPIKIRDAFALKASGKNPFCNLFYQLNFNIFYIIFALLKYFCYCYRRLLFKGCSLSFLTKSLTKMSVDELEN